MWNLELGIGDGWGVSGGWVVVGDFWVEFGDGGIWIDG